jgi:uncharacterized protein YvpB
MADRMLDASPPTRSESSSQPAVMWGLALVGLAAIGVSIWFVYMQRHMAESPPSLVPALAVHVRATRDAQAVEIEAYQAANDALRGEVVALQSELERVELELDRSRASPERPASEGEAVVLDRAPLALILDVPLLAQEHSLSCESSAAAMAAQYHNLDVRESDILDALPLHENPHLGFRGNVDGLDGGLIDYGVYAAPVGRVLSDLGLQVELFQGGVNEIKAHIRDGRPVLAWITYDLQVQMPQQWWLADASGRQQAVTLVPYEHTVLIVGYNREGLWVHDPLDGTRGFYPEGEFWRAFGYLGYMALVIGPPVR